jgi:hypothetical protein
LIRILLSLRGGSVGEKQGLASLSWRPSGDIPKRARSERPAAGGSPSTWHSLLAGQASIAASGLSLDRHLKN